MSAAGDWLVNLGDGIGEGEVVYINVCARYPIYDADKPRGGEHVVRENYTHQAIDKSPEGSESLSVRQTHCPHLSLSR